MLELPEQVDGKYHNWCMETTKISDRHVLENLFQEYLNFLAIKYPEDKNPIYYHDK